MIGESGRSLSINAMPRGIPTPPRNLSVRYGPGFIHIAWDPPLSDEGSPITGFLIYRNSTPPIVLTGDRLDYNDTDILNGVRYSYSVSAVNEIGESEKTETVWGFPLAVEVERYPPTPPRNLSVRIEDEMFILEWDPPEYDGGSLISGYRIHRALSADGNFDTVDTAEGLSWTDINITGNTEYHYCVTAFNSDHESLPSEKVHATLIVDIPQDDPEENGNIGIYIAAAVIVLVLVGIGIAFFLVYRKGTKEEETEDEDEYEQSGYDFESLKGKDDPITPENDSNNTF